MVWKSTKDNFRVRMAAINEEVWPPPRVNPQLPPDRSEAIPNSQFILDGGLHLTDTVKKMFDDINARYGTKAKPAY